MLAGYFFQSSTTNVAMFNTQQQAKPPHETTKSNCPPLSLSVRREFASFIRSLVCLRRVRARWFARSLTALRTGGSSFDCSSVVPPIARSSFARLPVRSSFVRPLLYWPFKLFAYHYFFFLAYRLFSLPTIRDHLLFVSTFFFN